MSEPVAKQIIAALTRWRYKSRGMGASFLSLINIYLLSMIIHVNKLDFGLKDYA